MPEQQNRVNRTADARPVEQGHDEITIDLVELAYKLLDRWKLIVCAALILAVVFGAYTQFMVKPTYEATSIIYVLSRSDSAINMADLQIGTALTADYIKVFNIWEVQEQVISQLNLPYTYKQLRNMVSVRNDSDTRMLDITVTSTNPEEAAAIANTYAEVVRQYIADKMKTDKPSDMSTALVPTAPAGPNKTRNILLGFMLGGMLAAGFVVVRMLLDDKYKTAEDIRKYTGLVTLAVVPVETYNDSRRSK